MPLALLLTFVKDALRGRGATLAYDPDAHADARLQVRKFLDERLRVDGR